MCEMCELKRNWLIISPQIISIFKMLTTKTIPNAHQINNWVHHQSPLKLHKRCKKIRWTKYKVGQILCWVDGRLVITYVCTTMCVISLYFQIDERIDINQCQKAKQTLNKKTNSNGNPGQRIW